MFTFFTILIVIVCLLIILIVLLQNPKGSGMAGGFSGAASNIIGVQKAGDVLEKGTWIMGIALLVLCVGSAFFTPKANTQEKIKTMSEQAAAGSSPSVPSAPAPAPGSNPLTPQ
jgi:preprotein translocase subunit SecG